MKTLSVLAAVMLAGSMGVVGTAGAQEGEVARLSQQLTALDAHPDYATLAAFERLQARQALQMLAEARSSDRAAALHVAQRRVEIAEVAARTESMQREVDRLDRERSELLVEASRRDAASARAEAERLRVQAQIQAEEAARLRQQADADAAAMQDVEAALVGVTDAATARLSAAREREAALAREEARLLAGGTLPPVRTDARGELFTLSGDAFASGQSRLTAAAATSIKALAAYLGGSPRGTIRIEGHTDSQGAADANLQLSERRAAAVRDALVAAGVPRSRIQAVGRGDAQPVADNGTAAGRAKNRRVEILVTN